MMFRHPPSIENPFTPEKHRSTDNPELIGKILGPEAEAAMRKAAPSPRRRGEGEVTDTLTLTPEQQAQFEKEREERRERERRNAERLQQAQTLFDKGWGKELGFERFEDYLATIPEVPSKPEQWKDRFDRCILVDDRIPLTKACALTGLKFEGDDNSTPLDSTKVKSGVRWMYCHDGRRNNNRKVKDCRDSFPKDEIGLDAMEGVSLYVNDPTIIDGYFVMLPSSVRADSRDDCATLGIWHDRGPRLDWRWGGFADPHCGAASRGEFDV